MLNYTHLSTPQDLETFNANDLANYGFVVLFDLGYRLGEVDKRELDLIDGSLARFMKKECLLVRADELEHASKESYIKSVYHIFESPTENRCYVAVATVFEDILDRILLKPVYHTLEWNTDESSRYPCLDAVNACLIRLRIELYITSLNDYPLPALHTTQHSLVCPNGEYIRELQEGIGTFNVVTDEHVSNPKGSSSVKFKSTSLKNARNSTPMRSETLSEIAEKLNAPLSKIVFEQLIPIPGSFKKLRTERGLTKNDLAKKFGLKSDTFFDLLEDAKILPPKAALFAFYQYKEHVAPTLKFRDLIDVASSDQLGRN